jgi:thymidylate synthase (FAD)
MKILTSPKVTVIAKQTFLGHPDYDIPDDGNDAVKLGAFAAKSCYDSFGKNGRPNEANQLALLEHRHGSVLEHITFTLFIEGITRGLSLESNRHRQLAVSQRSTRYTAEEDAAAVLEPYYAHLYEKYRPWLEDMNKDDIPTDMDFDLEELNFIGSHLAGLEMQFNRYENEVAWLMHKNPLGLTGFDLRKWARGKARNVLPHALETRICYTGNLRAWRWMIEARSDAHAEPEIRRLADHILQVLRKEAPLYFFDFENVGDVDGIPVWKPKYSKV